MRAATAEMLPASKSRISDRRRSSWGKVVMLSLLSAAPGAMAQSACVPLKGSKTCPAFDGASLSKNTQLLQLYPFLQNVTDAASFDEQLSSFVPMNYVQQRFQSAFGCSKVNFSNTSSLYARFTTSVICNVVVQLSINDCKLSSAAARPLCAESCAQYAQSEAYLVGNGNLCGTQKSGQDVQSQVRTDFGYCNIPSDSLSNCISGITNEPMNCGYGNSTLGLCAYCSSGGINSTDTCCYNSDVTNRCAGVVLPTITPSVALPTSTATSTASATSTTTPAVASGSTSNGLSGGAIAGIVIGAIAALALLGLLIFFCLRSRHKKGGSQTGSIFNQPSPSKRGASVTQVPGSSSKNVPPGFEVLPGGRIARMSALEGHSGDSPSRHGDSRHGGSAGATAAAAVAGFAAGRRRDHSSSSDFADSPSSDGRAGVLRPPPTAGRRNGSLSSGSLLVGEDPHSPTSAGGMSSPQALTSQQSEQLPFFKDYYSQDDIHPGDRVAVLWAYQPRAADEFALERGDMLKIVGIWDDGWATGIMMDERAEEWEARRQAQRDSGVSNTSGRGRDISPPVSGEIKAFPLVCVCLPEHWRKTIEGDGSTETTSTSHPGGYPS